MGTDTPQVGPSKMYKYLPKQKFYLSIDQLKHRNESEENKSLNQEIVYIHIIIATKKIFGCITIRLDASSYPGTQTDFS